MLYKLSHWLLLILLITTITYHTVVYSVAAYNVPKTGASVFPFRCVTFLIDKMVIYQVVFNHAVADMTAFYTKLVVYEIASDKVIVD